MAACIRVLVAVLFGLALPQQRLEAAVSAYIFASNFDPAPDCSSIGLAGCPGFAIETPSIDIAAGALVDACYPFRTPNAVSAIGRFSSITSSLVSHIIVWQTTDAGGLPADGLTPGTLTTNCGLSAGANGRTFTWLYAAHHLVDQLRMPDDDGTAKPISFELPANAAGFIEIIYLNTSGDTKSAPPVRFVANERPAGAYTSTATYTGIKFLITIPSGATSDLFSTCNAPTAPAYWWFSTQTHIHSTATKIERVGAVSSTILTSSGWQAPAIATYPTSPFYTLSAGDKLRITCTYVNDSGATLTFGDNYQNAEVCLGVAYVFPATQSQTDFTCF